MSDTAITIRMAEESDAQALLAIYAPYVEKTAVTFEYEVPTVLEFKNRIASTLKRYPYLAAIRDGHILGYAYASAFKERAALTGLWKPPSMCPKAPGAPARALFYTRHWKII